MARGIAATAASLLHAVQVETHGQYTAERLRLLHDFTTSASTSTFRLVIELVTTPLPCLAVILLLDAIPLDPPSAGTSANVGFWIRSSLSNAACSLCLITLYESAIPTLRLSRTHVGATTIVAAIGTQLTGYGLSLVIGFPLPFTMALMSPLYLTQLLALLLLASVSHLHSCPSARSALRDWIKVLVLMCSTIVIYPICNYVFEKATPYGQSSISLLMGCIRVAYKNAISRCIREHRDLRPEIASFQVEVPSALFVAFSMQNASSLLTIALLLIMDVVHAALTLYDIHHLAQRIAKLERESLGTSRFRGQLPRTNWVVPVSTKAPSSPHRTMIDHARAIVSSREESFIPRRMEVGSNSHNHLHWCQRICTRKVTQAPLPIDCRQVTAVTPNEAAVQARDPTCKSIESLPAPLSAEKAYTDAVLQLMYTTEFVVLSELIEIIIPVVYGLYMAAMIHMPNRAYLPYLATIDPADLQPVLINMLAYGLVEFASLFLLCAMLRRQLGFSPVSQLAMVLRTRWRSVQAALIFWLIINVQAPLEHYGVDYSFRFAWLRK